MKTVFRPNQGGHGNSSIYFSHLPSILEDHVALNIQRASASLCSKELLPKQQLLAGL